MSDTPETDTAERMAFAQEQMVPTEVARKLERERDEARNQRDILRLDAQKEDIHHDRMIGELERVYAERDEARELAQQMSESNQVLLADVRFYRNAWEQLKEAAE
jgi:hypothetical protein